MEIDESSAKYILLVTMVKTAMDDMKEIENTILLSRAKYIARQAREKLEFSYRGIVDEQD